MVKNWRLRMWWMYKALVKAEKRDWYVVQGMVYMVENEE